MDTVVCPKCAAENPTSTVNCSHCGPNLQSAAEHPEQLGDTKPEAQPPQAQSRRKPLTRRQKVRDVLIGFFAWLAINGGIWLIVASRMAWVDFRDDSNEGLVANLLLLPLNVLVLVLLAFLRRWIALGMLMALALNLLVALGLGLTTLGACGIPFFVGLLP